MKKYIILLFILALSLPLFGQNDTLAPKALLLPINGEIETGLSKFVKRAFDKAKDEGIELVILEMDTPGGRVDAGVEIKDILLESDIKSVAFVSKQAISAGALIAISCNDIVISSNATIGDVQPIPTSPKTVSYVSAIMRNSAEVRNRNVKIAEAMVNAELELYVQDNDSTGIAVYTGEELEDTDSLQNYTKLVGVDEIVTFTAEEAMKYGYADNVANDLDSLLAIYNIGSEELELMEPELAEAIVRFLTSHVVSGFLLTLGFFGILMELRSPGWGIPGTIGAVAVVLFFWGHYIADLVGIFELFLFALGILLLIIEAFFIPGFGVFGILGILFTGGGLILSLVKYMPTDPLFQFELPDISNVLFYTIILTLVFFIFFIKFLPKSKKVQELVLDSDMKDAKSSDILPVDFIGMEAVVLKQLRPVGKIKLGGKEYEAQSYGEFFKPGEKVLVSEIKNGKLIVKRFS